MRIGEILLQHGWIDATGLRRALAEQAQAGKRLCSLLIARGLLDPDDASRALGEQHDVAAVLQRHLEHRDPALAALLPPELARTCCALPIGRNREGDLIICVRDPRPGVHTALAQAIKGRIMLAVAPAIQLERLIDLAYEPSPHDEYDVDLSPGVPAPAHAAAALSAGVAIQFRSRSTTTQPAAPAVPERGFDLGPDLGPDLGSMTLVELDDHRVVKDPTQSGQFTVPSRGTTIPPPSRVATLPPPMRAPTIAETIAALDSARSRDEATEVAMRFALRWSSSLLLAVDQDVATGTRGHGPQLSAAAVQAVSIPLSAPSIVKVAHDWRRMATESPQGAGTIQERLVRLLGQPRIPTAVPIIVATRVAYVLAVGEPIGGGEAARELERLAGALGEAYTRMQAEP